MIGRRAFMTGALAAPFVLSAPLRAEESPGRLAIAVLPGLGYAPLTLAKQGGWIEKAVPGLQVTWLQIASSSAIREGMLAGDIDAGAGSVAPFLIGRDRGFKVGLVSALTIMDLLLLTNDPEIHSLKDFNPGKKIAVPAPDTNQAFAVRFAAKQELDDAHALDGSFLAMPHPDALQALLTNQIAGYMSSPPFQNQAVARGARVLANSRDLFGPLTFSICFATEAFARKSPAAVQALRDAIAKGITLLKSQPSEAAAILAADTGSRVSAAEFGKLLADPDIQFTDAPEGVSKLSIFMRSTGFLREPAGAIGSMMLKG